VQKSDVVRIAAVMAVSGAKERFEIRPQEKDGWFGTTATGDFGRVEGWIRLSDVNTRPPGFAAPAPKRRIDFCGRSRDGELCLV
jgi:hypothetical protein